MHSSSVSILCLLATSHHSYEIDVECYRINGFVCIPVLDDVELRAMQVRVATGSISPVWFPRLFSSDVVVFCFEFGNGTGAGCIFARHGKLSSGSG